MSIRRLLLVSSAVVAAAILLSYVVLQTTLPTSESGSSYYYAPRLNTAKDPAAPLWPYSWSIAGSEGIKFALPRDAIPAITEPEIVSAEEEGLKDDEDVIGVAIGQEARAYPLSIMYWHETVDDVVGDTPVAVTFCPLCGSVLTFDRTVDGELLVFKVSGGLFHNNLVMYDTKTFSLWPQLMAKAVFGPLTGQTLQIVPSARMTWAQWKALHPDTTVLRRPTEFHRDSDFNPYRNYVSSNVAGLYGWENRDYRLNPKEFVVGLTDGIEFKAYSLTLLRKQGAINDWVGSLPVAVVYDGESGIIRVFNRAIDGQVVTLELRTDSLVDTKSGRKWSIWDGSPTNVETSVLEPVEHVIGYWSCWKDFYPTTEVYSG